MSLDHVYIVLEPVGSARLTFDDDQYYEFMSFDVPKEFGVPEWSRCKDRYIGRLYSDIGKVPSDSGIFRSIWALLGHTGIEEKGQKEGALLVRIGQGVQPPFPSPSPKRKGES